MAAKYYITNGDKYIGDNESVVDRDISQAKKFKYSEAIDYIKNKLNDDPEWGFRKAFNRASKKNYVITTGINYVASKGKVTNDFSKAKPFNSVANAQAYLNNNKDISQYFTNPLIIDEDGNPCDLSVRREFTPEQLETLGLVTSTPTRRILIRKDIRDKVFDRDKGICGICGKPVSVDNYTIDHIVPLSRNGTNDIDNFRVAHRKCNLIKGSFKDSEMNNIMFDIVSNNVSNNPFNDNSAKLIRALVRGELSHYGY